MIVETANFCTYIETKSILDRQSKANFHHLINLAIEMLHFLLIDCYLFVVLKKTNWPLWLSLTLSTAVTVTGFLKGLRKFLIWIGTTFQQLMNVIPAVSSSVFEGRKSKTNRSEQQVEGKSFLTCSFLIPNTRPIIYFLTYYIFGCTWENIYYSTSKGPEINICIRVPSNCAGLAKSKDKDTQERFSVIRRCRNIVTVNALR